MQKQPNAPIESISLGNRKRTLCQRTFKSKILPISETFIFNKLSPLTNDSGKFLPAFFFQIFLHERVQLLFFSLNRPVGTIAESFYDVKYGS